MFKNALVRVGSAVDQKLATLTKYEIGKIVAYAWVFYVLSVLVSCAL